MTQDEMLRYIQTKEFAEYKRRILEEYKQDYKQALSFRKELAAAPINYSDSIAEKIRREVSEDFVKFCNWFVWTYDPRSEEGEREKPFVLFPAQKEDARIIIQAIDEGFDLLIEKSRDMGLTWLVLAIFVWGYFFKKWNLKCGSKKDETVDTIGDIDSLFERMRFIIDKLPPFIIPYEKLSLLQRTRRRKKITLPDEPQSITGEATTETFSRSGRFRSILLDEFGFIEPKISEYIWTACGDSTKCRIALSTIPPTGVGKFMELRETPIKKITRYWYDHPFKSKEWYLDEITRRSKPEIATELNIDPMGASDNRLLDYAVAKNAMSRITDKRVITHKVIAMDIARMGEDKTIIKIGGRNEQGEGIVMKTFSLDKNRLTELPRIIKTLYKPGDIVVFDAITIGQFMIDEMWEANINAIGFNGSLKLDKGEYANLRAKAYFEAAEILRKGMVYDEDEVAIRQFAMMWYEFNHKGQKLIPDKKTLRSKKMKSPDNADCLMMWIYGLAKIPLVKANVKKESLFWARVKQSFRKEPEWEMIDMRDSTKHKL